KQKTAYEITRRDWSSDVCSSDLAYFAQVSSLEWPRGGADFTLARSPSLRGTLHPQPSESTAIGSGIRSKSSAAYFLRALARSKQQMTCFESRIRLLCFLKAAGEESRAD